MSTHTGHESVLVCGRAQRDDVFRGVVFDGLDSVFANSFVHTLHSVLKALNNRRHIFAVTLKNDFATIKQQQKRLQAEKGSCFTSCARRRRCHFWHATLTIALRHTSTSSSTEGGSEPNLLLRGA